MTVEIDDDDPRLTIAAIFVMKHRQGIPDDAEVTYTSDEIRTFLNGLDRRQWRMLREIARGIEEKGTVSIQ